MSITGSIMVSIKVSIKVSKILPKNSFKSGNGLAISLLLRDFSPLLCERDLSWPQPPFFMPNFYILRISFGKQAWRVLQNCKFLSLTAFTLLGFSVPCCLSVFLCVCVCECSGVFELTSLATRLAVP